MNTIKYETSVKEDKYTDYIKAKYDLQVTDKVTTEIDMLDIKELKDFNIVLIIGNSGSGKSIVLRNMTKRDIKDFAFDNDKACVSQFNCEVEKVTEVFNAVGFSSVPVRLHKPNSLSNGERARLEIASKLITADGHVIYIDEFTSVVDRNVAKSIARNVASYARKHNLKLVIASCHFDIIDYLNPDYIFNLNKKINGHTQLEHFVYKDNYSAYANINKEALLTEVMEVVC